MKQAWLIRDGFSETHTSGRLILDGTVLHTLELPWLGNLVMKSCIPSGSYFVNYLAKSASGKYKDVYHITDVGGRTGILIHKGNVTGHTLGCVLIGLIKGMLGNEQAVLSSAVGLQRLHSWAKRESFMLHVVSSKDLHSDRLFED